MTDQRINEITDDELGAPSQEESDESWLGSLSPQQREQYGRGVAATDEFLNDERTKQYKPTDANQEKLLAFLERHDLPLSFGGLYVAFEQLSEAGELELNSEEEDQRADEDQPRRFRAIGHGGISARDQDRRRTA